MLPHFSNTRGIEQQEDNMEAVKWCEDLVESSANTVQLEKSGYGPRGNKKGVFRKLTYNAIPKHNIKLP